MKEALSIVCEEKLVPEEIQVERGWKLFRDRKYPNRRISRSLRNRSGICARKTRCASY